MRTTGRILTVVTVTAALAVAMPADAQRGARGGGPDGPRGGGPGLVGQIDAALENAGTLGVDAAAVEALRALRAEVEPVQAELRQEMESFRNSMRSQDPPADDAERTARREAHQTAMEAIRTRHQTRMAPYLERFEATLTVEQRMEVRNLVRAGMRDRGDRGRPGGMRRPGGGTLAAAVVRGPGPRGNRGLRSGRGARAVRQCRG